MLTKEGNRVAQVEMFSVEEFVPHDHLLRKIDRVVDFTYIYSIVEDLYCKDNGRPSIDPVVLFKMVLIQHIYGIPSLRKTAEEVKMNVAYRWFLGYLMNEQTPHFATISYNFKNRFTTETINKVFYWILKEIATQGYLDTDSVFIDGTHIKASANINKVIKVTVPATAKVYQEQLLNEINEDREDNDKKPFDQQPPEDKKIIQSTTDPDCGVFHKGQHKKCMAYCSQTVCDSKGYILEATVNAGNMHDSVAFDEVYNKVTTTFSNIQNIVCDAGYKTPWICKKIIEDNKVPVIPYTRPHSKKGYFRSKDYVYDQYHDSILCPADQALEYSTTNRDGKREYKSDKNICQHCLQKEQCTNSKNHQKIVARHLWQEYMEEADGYRYMPEYRELYSRRKETIERVFADAKEKHGMRYTHYRGITQVTNWVKLKYTAMNLKKYAKHAYEQLCARIKIALNHLKPQISPLTYNR